MGLINRINTHFIKRKLNKEGRGIYIDFLSYVDKNSTFEGYNRITGKSVIFNSHVGKYSYAVGAVIGNATIGKFCSIATGAKIGGLGSHPTAYLSTHPIFYSSKSQCGISFTKKDYYKEENFTEIGNDVWIGANAIIMDGVRIGDGAIIAAGSIVTKDVQPYTIVAGVPAVIKKYRCSTEDASLLQKLAWWNWPHNVLSQYSYLFRNSIDTSLHELKKINSEIEGID